MPLPDKAFQLFALLAFASQSRIERRFVAALLWDSDAEGAGLRNLRQLLFRLRDIKGVPALVETDSTGIWLVDDLKVDVTGFMACSASDNVQDLRAGLALADGELLSAAQNCTKPFEEWLADQRIRMAQLFAANCETVLREITRYGAGEHQRVREICRLLISHCPEDEAAYRTVITAFGRNGMGADARATFTALQSMLADELDTVPTDETVAVMRRINAQRRTVYDPPGHAERPQPRPPRVAFMPLNVTADGLDSAVIHALIDDVANELCRFRTFTVLAAHSSFQLDTRGSEARAKLNCDFAVTGFISPDGENMSLRLVDIRSDQIIWSARYSIDPDALRNTFQLLSAQIVSTLAEAIESHSGERPGEKDAGSYVAFLKGRDELRQCTLPQVRRARKHFQSTLNDMPAFSVARALLAQTLYLEWLMLGGNDPEVLVQARKEADVAVAEDPGSGDGHWISGVIALYQRDYARSSEEFTRAETLCPNSSDMLVQYADALGHFGQAAEGMLRFEQAIDRNPLAPDHFWWAGAGIAFELDDYQRAIDLCAHMENDDAAVRLLAACHGLLEHREEARRYGHRIKDLYPGTSVDSLSKIAPDQNTHSRQRFVEGLRLAQL